MEYCEKEYIKLLIKLSQIRDTVLDCDSLITTGSGEYVDPEIMEALILLEKVHQVQSQVILSHTNTAE